MSNNEAVERLEALRAKIADLEAELDFFRQHSKPNRPRSPSERKVFLGQLDSSSVIVDSWPDWQKSAFGVI